MANANGAGIEFRQVLKRYGKAGTEAAVKGINFTVPKGTLTTILGPSGCGKTTTLRMIAGLELPTSGEVWIDGENVTTRGASERNVSLVFQSYALFPHMSVIDNVAYGLSVSGVNKADAAARARNALAGVGLTGFDARMPSELSGGQQQRVAVARALVLEPSVLLFDEPLSNLDARLRRSMREDIRALQQRLKLTVAYVTHDQGEALAVSDQIIVMDQGVIAQTGTPQALYERPQSAFVAGFMGEAMLLPAKLNASGQVQLGDITLAGMKPDDIGGTFKLAVRPEAWNLSRVVMPNSMRGVVAKRAYLGHAYEIVSSTGLGDILAYSHEAELPWDIGADVFLHLPTTRGLAVIQG